MSNIENLQQISKDFYCIVVKYSLRSFSKIKNQPRRTTNKNVIAENPKKVPILNMFEHSLNVPVKSCEVFTETFEVTVNAEKCVESGKTIRFVVFATLQLEIGVQNGNLLKKCKN